VVRILIFENCITVDVAAANMVQSPWYSVMIRKNVLDCVLDSSEIVQEFSDKSLLKQVLQKGRWGGPPHLYMYLSF
jgi:hypothetical protein